MVLVEVDDGEVWEAGWVRGEGKTGEGEGGELMGCYIPQVRHDE